MRFLRRRSDEPATDSEVGPIACPHVTLVARWDNADDIGHEDRASSLRCEACSQEFSLEEATHLRETEAERLRQRIAG
jgi:hypothetical protein